MIIKANIIPTICPNFPVPKNSSSKNLIIVFEIAASVIAVTATSPEMVVLARRAILMVIASTSANPDINAEIVANNAIRINVRIPQILLVGLVFVPFQYQLMPQLQEKLKTLKLASFAYLSIF